jgi:hypothetical protein
VNYYLVKTKLGAVRITPRGLTSIAFGAHSWDDLHNGASLFTYRGVAHKVFGNLNFDGNDWQLGINCSVERHNRTLNQEVPASSTRAAILETIRTAIAAWAQANGNVLERAEYDSLGAREKYLAEEIGQLKSQIENAQSRIASNTAALDEAKKKRAAILKLWGDLPDCEHSPKTEKTVRETANYKLVQVESETGGVRYFIKCKDTQAQPQAVRASKREVESYLKNISDSEFDGTCCLDFGCGAFQRKEPLASRATVEVENECNT